MSVLNISSMDQAQNSDSMANSMDQTQNSNQMLQIQFGGAPKRQIRTLTTEEDLRDEMNKVRRERDTALAANQLLKNRLDIYNNTRDEFLGDNRNLLSENKRLKDLLEEKDKNLTTLESITNEALAKNQTIIQELSATKQKLQTITKKYKLNIENQQIMEQQFNENKAHKKLIREIEDNTNTEMNEDIIFWDNYIKVTNETLASNAEYREEIEQLKNQNARLQQEISRIKTHSN